MKKDMAYYELIRIVHDKVPAYISFLLMLKLDFTDNIIFYIVSFFLRFNSILILCGNFQLSKREVNENETISKYFRYFTCNFILYTLKITNLIYIIISFIIFILFCIRMSLYFYVIKKLRSKENLTKIKLTKYQIFMDHFVFLFYPFILEFLSQIYITYIFPDNYFFKRDKSEIINIIIILINTFLLICYNINNYYYLHVINRPLCDRNVPVKYRYSRGKFWSIFLLHNVSIIQCLDFYFNTDRLLEIYTYCYFCFFALIFIIFFWTSLSKFNYSTITNHFISIMSGFCFFSILSEALVRFLKYEIKSTYSLIIFNLCKIIVSAYFDYLNAKMNNKKSYQMAKIELFKINKGKISNELIYDAFLYTFDVLKNIKKLKKNVSTINLLNMIYEHQNKCNSNNCKCRLIQILPHGKQFINNFTENLIERIGFLIESAFAQNDFSNDYDLTLILCEHFCLFKENPIMAYSLLQTLLYFNLSILSMGQLLILYETFQKYIENSLSFNWHKTFMKRYGEDHHLSFRAREDMISNSILKEKKFRQTFLVYSKIIEIQLMMSNYCMIASDIMKQKNLLEETAKIIKSEEGTEINKVEFPYLSTENVENLIQIFKNETKTHNHLLELIANLKTSKLPIEFYYKIFLFFEVFYGGKIKEDLLPTFYGFTNDHNLYSVNINPNIYILLRQRFIDLNKQGFSSHYCIFKYTQGMTISYFSEPLSQELGYYNEDLFDKNINILLPLDIAKPHDNMMLHYLITDQYRTFPTINNRMFNKKGMSINSLLTGASLPGLGKYLLIITNIELIENNKDLYFYYNSNLELISISNNNYKLMNLDLNLISNFKLNLLSIYNIDENKIKERLNIFKPLLDEFKYSLDIKSEEFFTKKLFKQPNKNKIGKFKLIEEIENRQNEEEKNVININEKTLKTQRIIESIYNNKNKKKIKIPGLKFNTVKGKVIQNINKYLSENENIDFNDKSYNKLSESFGLFKNCTDKSLDKNLNNHTIDNIIDITIKIEILYDTPFISVKIHEQINNDELTNHNLVPFSREFSTRKGTKSSNKLSNNNRTIDTGKKSMTTLKSQTISTIAITKMLNIQNKFKENKTKCEKYISQIIFFLLFCIFIVYIIILIYQLKIVSNLKLIFLAFYYNYIQRNKLSNLYSFLLTGYFRYMKLVNYDDVLTFRQFSINIANVAKRFSSAFHTFYQKYVKYRFALGKDLSTLYENFNISKINVNWDIDKVSTNYMDEVENLVYSAILSAKDDDENEISTDCENFFNAKYENLIGFDRRVKSSYMTVLFYLCSNYQDVYSIFFKGVESEIQNSFDTYSYSTKISYILIESLGLIINVFIIIIVIYYLLKTNKVIFKNVANLFIDFTQEGEYNFKNNHDNYIVMEKLKQLQFLLNNFSLKAIDKFNKKLNTNSIDLNQNLSQDISNENITSLDYKNNKNTSPDKKINQKLNEKTTLNNTNTKSSLFNSKTNNKLINEQNVDLIAKLNQKMDKQKSVSNMSSDNSLLSNLNMSSIPTNNNKKKEETKLLTIETVIEKLQINDIKKIKIYFWVLLGIILLIIIYFFIKIVITTNYLANFSILFEVYYTVTYQFGKVINYFNNLQLLFINQKLGKESALSNLFNEVAIQTEKENKIKAKYLSKYKKAYDLFQALNRKQNDTTITIFEDVLCETNQYCRKVLNSNYNLVNNGIDIALNAMIIIINNFFNDFLRLKNELISLQNISYYFINFKYTRIDLSLNYLLSLVQDRSNTVFFEQITELVNDIDTQTISLNMVIIIFIVIYTIIIVFVIIKNILDLDALILSSTSRINRSTCYIKIQNLSD